LRKGTGVVLLLWIVGIALRLGIAVIARHQGVATSVSTGEIPLFLGITLAAQNLVIWNRGHEMLVPGGTPAG
jgi:hypothetical protein